MLKNLYVRIIFIIFCLMFFSILTQVLYHSDNRAEFTNTSRDQGREAVNSKVSKLRSFSSNNSNATQKKNTRQNSIEALKAEWLTIGRSGGDLNARNDLAIKTINTLLCSEELLELSNFLTSLGISVGDMQTLEKGARGLFDSDHSAEARSLLIELAENTKYTQTIYDWSLYAGEGCPLDVFEDFHGELSSVSEIAANMALMGRNRKLVLEKPSEALKSSLSIADSTPNAGFYITEQIDKMPSTVDYQKLALVVNGYKEVIPEVSNNAIDGLFSKWAARDAKAAANHVLANPGSYSPNIITVIAERGVGSYSEDFEFVKQFTGVYRNEAAKGMISKHWMRATESEIRSVLNLINDTEIVKQIENDLNIKINAGASKEYEGGY